MVDFLENLVLWEVASEDGLQRVYLEGDFSETTDFTSLTRRLRGVVEFDAAGVRYINSSGAHRWIAFLRTLTDQLALGMEARRLAEMNTWESRSSNILRFARIPQELSL